MNNGSSFVDRINFSFNKKQKLKMENLNRSFSKIFLLLR